MAAPKIYGQMLSTINGSLLLEVHTIDKSTVNKDQDVETLALGWSGYTPGPKTTQMKIEAFLPATGMEQDFDKLEQTGQFVTMGLIMIGGSKKQSVVGVIRHVNVKSGVGQNSTVTFDFIGQPAAFV